MANFTLTAGADAVASGATDDTVCATAATLDQRLMWILVEMITFAGHY